MLSDDEDELHALSYSDPRREERSDHGKMEALKREIKAKTGRAPENAKLEAKALGRLSELKREVIGKDVKPQEKVPPADEKTPGAAKTKTHREQEKADVTTAQDKPDADTILDRQQEATPVSDEEVQSEPG